MPKTLGFHAALTLAIKVTAAAVSYAFVFALSRMMELGDFGTVSAIMTASLLLSVVGSVGQKEMILRFIPPLKAKGGQKEISGLINAAFSLSFAISLGIWLLGSLGAFLAARMGYVANWQPIALGLLLIPMVGWIDLQAALARSYQAIATALVPKEIAWRAAAAVAIGALFYLGGGHKVGLTAALSCLIATLGALIVLQALALRRMTHLPRIKPGAYFAQGTDWKPTVSVVI